MLVIALLKSKWFSTNIASVRSFTYNLHKYLSKIVRCISVTSEIIFQFTFEIFFYLPVCNLLCFFKKYLVVNIFLQTSHSHCRLSCTLTCWLRWDSLLNTFSQFGVGHLNPGCWGVSKHSKLSETIMGLTSEHSGTLKWILKTI